MYRPNKYTALSKEDFLSKSKEKRSSGVFETAEKIRFKTQYGKEDLVGLNHVKFVSGLPPFLGGPYSSIIRVGLGPCANMPDSQRPKTQTPFIKEI
jgi:hypothetical protein